MGASTGIEWTTATWNPIGGCRRISPGCQNCYAEREAWRFAGPGLPYEGLVNDTKMGPRWSGKTVLRRHRLSWPLYGPARECFVGSMSDVFLEQIPEEYSQAIWGIMAALPFWTFQALTKRPGRARDILSRTTRADALASATRFLEGARDKSRFARARSIAGVRPWPPPNVWLGTSVEDQTRAEQRLPELIQAPAAVRFVSAEPLLGPVKLSRWLAPSHELPSRHGAPHGVRQVIAGGESGPGARPMHPDWARSLRDECRMVGTAFFFKQWGGWMPTAFEAEGCRHVPCQFYGPALVMPFKEELIGRLLDGVVWSGKP